MTSPLLAKRTKRDILLEKWLLGKVARPFALHTNLALRRTIVLAHILSVILRCTKTGRGIVPRKAASDKTHKPRQFTRGLLTASPTVNR